MIDLESILFSMQISLHIAANTFPFYVVKSIIGHLLNTSFWIYWEGLGSGVIINAIISP
jgi:hypothetical protein